MAIVFGLENPTFLAKSDLWIPKCTGVLDSAHSLRRLACKLLGQKYFVKISGLGTRKEASGGVEFPCLSIAGLRGGVPRLKSVHLHFPRTKARLSSALLACCYPGPTIPLVRKPTLKGSYHKKFSIAQTSYFG